MEQSVTIIKQNALSFPVEWIWPGIRDQKLLSNETLTVGDICICLEKSYGSGLCKLFCKSEISKKLRRFIFVLFFFSCLILFKKTSEACWMLNIWSPEGFDESQSVECSLSKHEALSCTLCTAAPWWGNKCLSLQHWGVGGKRMKFKAILGYRVSSRSVRAPQAFVTNTKTKMKIKKNHNYTFNYNWPKLKLRGKTYCQEWDSLLLGLRLSLLLRCHFYDCNHYFGVVPNGARDWT